MKLRKKLIEVALPLEAINRGCEEDKNRKTGHIRNLHKWFAPMPLPAWRAMLFASLIDDPGEYLPEQEGGPERERLLALVERLSKFEAHKDHELLTAVREELTRALGSTAPIIVDPFCGGGSTLLEAQRLGLATRASDLNPVPVLITTVLCRIPSLFRHQPSVSSPKRKRLLEEPRDIEGLKADVAHYAGRVRELAWEALNKFYPPISGATPFAYRWAWAVASPNPAAQGKHTPLVSNWWLSRHRTATAWVEPIPEESGIRFELRTQGEASKPTTGRAGATCLYTNTPIPLEYVRQQGRAGLLRPVMFAIGARKDGRVMYLTPDEEQIAIAASLPASDLAGIPMPPAALSFRVQQYGLTNFLELFTRRQARSLETFAKCVAEIREEVVRDAVAAGMPLDGMPLESGGSGAHAYADAIAAILGLCVGKMAQSNSILVRWFIDPRNGSGKATPAFDRHAVPMVWDFVETNPFGDSVGDWTGPILETAIRAFDLCSPEGIPAQVQQQDARLVANDVLDHALIATDPPYFANIGYADLSDFFYLWLREALRTSFPRTLETMASPKNEELIASPHRHGGNHDRANEYFREGFGKVFGGLAHKADPRFPLLIVYAIKQAEEEDGAVGSTGWEVFLGGLVDAGLTIVATWPVRTTTDTRMIGKGTNALASAIFVVGRNRGSDAPIVTLRQFQTALKSELPNALKLLQRSNIAPVDLAQAAIGPGMGVYTRYAKVLEADGRPLSVRDALALINRTLDEALTDQEGDLDPTTRWAVAWFDHAGFADGDFGLAETLSKAKNISVNNLREAGFVKSARGFVRLLKPNELAGDWDPKGAADLTAWEMVHRLIHALESGGEDGAAALASALGSKTEPARELSYRLYNICERKKRSQEALQYNSLVQSWPEITRLAHETPPTVPQQAEFFG